MLMTYKKLPHIFIKILCICISLQFYYTCHGFSTWLCVFISFLSPCEEPALIFPNTLLFVYLLYFFIPHFKFIFTNFLKIVNIWVHLKQNIRFMWLLLGYIFNSQRFTQCAFNQFTLRMLFSFYIKSLKSKGNLILDFFFKCYYYL